MRLNIPSAARMVTVASMPLPRPAIAWRRAPPAPWRRERFDSRFAPPVAARQRRSAAKPPRPAQDTPAVQRRGVLDALFPPNQKSVFALVMASATAQAAAGDGPLR